MSLSILQNVTRADIRRDPFPHVVMPQALDPALYAALADQFPATARIAGERPTRNRKFGLNGLDLLAQAGLSPLWREFVGYHVSQAFYDEFMAVFGDEVIRLYPKLAAVDGRPPSEFRVKPRSLKNRRDTHSRDDFVLDCQVMIDDTSDPRICRGPHVDDPAELFAGLIYFRHPEDKSEGGDLCVVRSRNDGALFPASDTVRITHEPAEVDPVHTEIVARVPYRPNAGVMFINSSRSLHSVTMRSASSVVRRHVNIIGETYSLNPHGLFQIERVKSPMGMGARLSRLRGMVRRALASRGEARRSK